MRLADGRAWKSWDHSLKTGYVVGFADGMRLDRGGPDDRNRLGTSYIGNSTFGEVVDAVDDLYRDPANVQLTVAMAMAYFQDKVNGTSPQKLADQLALLRRVSADQQ